MIINDRKKLLAERKKLKAEGKSVVFTNGCFDLIHAGHIDYLCKAKQMGDILIVALNTDESVKRIKGKKRPITNEDERLFVMDNLKCVDIVTTFDEDTPANIIDELIPDVLVKGADWSIENIVGSSTVLSNGGKVKNIEFTVHQSTTKIINKISEIHKD
jgi:rfaE bifunctional protein nucleotidyltransferase chain/domain